MKVKRKSLIIITEDHGGYKGGFCAVCKRRGWIDKLNAIIDRVDVIPAVYAGYQPRKGSNKPSSPPKKL